MNGEDIGKIRKPLAPLTLSERKMDVYGSIDPYSFTPSYMETIEKKIYKA